MGKMTFVVEYEDGKEPLLKESVEAFGGKLLLVSFNDYRDGKLTQSEVSAINHAMDFSKLKDTCKYFEVNYDVVVAKL